MNTQIAFQSCREKGDQIGVSGGPGGEADEACAKAGIKAIEDQLDF